MLPVARTHETSRDTGRQQLLRRKKGGRTEASTESESAGASASFQHERKSPPLILRGCLVPTWPLSGAHFFHQTLFQLPGTPVAALQLRSASSFSSCCRSSPSLLSYQFPLPRLLPTGKLREVVEGKWENTKTCASRRKHIAFAGLDDVYEVPACTG